MTNCQSTKFKETRRSFAGFAPLQTTAPRKRALVSVTGLTLVEMLIVASLMAVTASAVYSLLSSGLKVYSRMGDYGNNLDVNIFFSRFSEDVKNMFFYSNIEFSGTGERMAFASFHKDDLAPEEDGPARFNRLRRITYLFNPAQKTISRRESNYLGLQPGDNGGEFILAKNIHACRFEYFYYDHQGKLTSASPNSPRDIPMAVRVTVDFRQKNNNCSLTRTVEIPISG